MKINTLALSCFLGVARHESYTKAANELGLSQPSVHQYVKRLEGELRTKLVEQHGKRVVLTEHGRVVYQYARRMEDEESDLIRYLRDDNSLMQGQIRLAGGTTASEFLLPTIAVAFQRLHPNIDIRIRVADLETDSGVAGRQFDLGITSDQIPFPGLDKVPFLEDELVGIAPVGHRFLSAKKPVAPDDFLNERVVHFGPTDVRIGRVAPIQQLINNWFSAGGVEPQSHLAITSLQGMKRAVRDGGGVAIISQYAIDPAVAGLETFPLLNAPRRQFVMVSRDHGWESNVVRSFREYAMSLEWAKGDTRKFTAPKSANGVAHARSI